MLKRKKVMILSTDVKKAFDKIQQPFRIKAISKPGTEANFLSLLRTIYKKPTANTMLN